MGSSTPVLQYSSTPALQYSKTRKRNSGPPRTSGNQRAPEGTGAHWGAGPDPLPNAHPVRIRSVAGLNPHTLSPTKTPHAPRSTDTHSHPHAHTQTHIQQQQMNQRISKPHGAACVEIHTVRNTQHGRGPVNRHARTLTRAHADTHSHKPNETGNVGGHWPAPPMHMHNRYRLHKRRAFHGGVATAGSRERTGPRRH